jgi:glycosyltransferase involved in cell wall biosynthesis
MGVKMAGRLWTLRLNRIGSPSRAWVGRLASMNISAVSVVVPCYNERAGIGPLLDELDAKLQGTGVQFQYVVVDDGSTDGSGEIPARDKLLVVRHEVNRGYGAALKTGIRSAAHDWILIIDADGTYPVDRIPELVKEAELCDMAVGARIGQNVSHSIVRRAAKWPIHRLADYLVDRRIPDLNSGLRMFKKDLAMRYIRLLPDGFSFTSTITLAMMADGWRVRYTTIDYFKREGRSKVKPIKDAINYFTLVMRMILFFNPLKIFLPLSFALFFAFLASLGYDIWLRNLNESTLILLIGFLQMTLLGFLADLVNRRGTG